MRYLLPFVVVFFSIIFHNGYKTEQHNKKFEKLCEDKGGEVVYIGGGRQGGFKTAHKCIKPHVYYDINTGDDL